MKKILLINPPVSIYLNRTAFMPLPLLVLGTCLKNIQGESLDFSFEILDLDLMLKKGLLSDDLTFYEHSIDIINENNPDIIFFTVHGLNHIVVLRLSEILKKQGPSYLIVVGGVGPTLRAKKALGQCPNIDIIVKGEGEPVLKQLITAAFTNGDYSKVPSIVYRKDGRVFENPRCYLNTDDPIPSPDYSLLSIEDYITHNKKNPYIHPGFVLIESGRGCPNSCSFCAPAKMWEGRVRYRPVLEIINEMKFLAENGGDFSFFTQDNLEEDFLRSLSETIIDEGVDIPWGCYSRIDHLSADIAGLLSKAGCRIIFTGFETPNRNAQKTIKKIIDTDAAFKTLQDFNANGISLIGSFIAGFLDENEEDLDHTMHFAIECATSLRVKQLNQFITEKGQGKLPQKGVNICSIHPLSYMPGTDSFEKEKSNLHITNYSIHPDCYGSFLFSYDEFKNDWSYLGGNPYLNRLSEGKGRFYCTTLRIFNLLNSRPYYFGLLLMTLEQRPLALMKTMVSHLGEEFVLNAKIEEFEKKCKDFINAHLDFIPEWTVKKGQ